MKLSIALAVLFFGFSASAEVRLKPGMKLADDSLKLKGNQTASLKCDLYTTRVENHECKESTLLVSASQNVVVGAPTVESVRVHFPAPYESVGITANLMLSSYGESGYENYSPDFQAFFENGSNTEETSFSIQNPDKGSKILLRDTYNFSATSMLSYQCSVNFD